MERFVKIVMTDPAVNTIAGFAGGGTVNQGRFFIMLKPLAERGKCQNLHFWQSCPTVTADNVINRLRGKLAVVLGGPGFNYVGQWTSNNGAVLEFTNEIEGITSFFEKRPPNFPPLKEDTP